MAVARNGKNKKEKNLVKKFIKIVLLTVFIFILMASSLVFAYCYIIMDKEAQTEVNTDDQAENSGSLKKVLDDIFKPQDLKTTIAVMGVDGDETRTDTIFVVRFDGSAGAVNLLSIPRDTRVQMTDEMIADLKARKRYVPSKGVCKINEVHSYAGKEKANEFSVLMLEKLLNIDIDYYIEMNLIGFKEIVDAIGGIELDVPRNMKYSDPEQDLYINLKKGLQVLDGDKAEQFVRFRSYPTGDEGRVEMQQMFMKEFAKKLLNSTTIKNNAPTLIRTYFEYFKTDMPITDALKYVQYVNKLSTDNISMRVLPGEGKYVGAVSYFLNDEKATQEMVQEFFFDIPKAVKETPVLAQSSSKDKNIEISNGGRTQGLAGKFKDKLTEEGYNVVVVNTYPGEKEADTRIFVKEDGMGMDLLERFTANPKLETNPNMLDEKIDIKVILGVDEK